MIHFGGAALCQDSLVRITPRGERRVFLGEMNDGGLVAPLEQSAHRGSMRPGKNESFQVRFRRPASTSPKCVAAIAEKFDAEVARGFSRLRCASLRIDDECEEETPLANAQTGDGDEGHEAFSHLQAKCDGRFGRLRAGSAALDETEEIAGRDARTGENEIEVGGAKGFVDDFAEDLPVVRGEGEVAALIELIVAEAGPASVDFSTFDLTAKNKHGVGVSVIGAAGSVFAGG